MITTLDLQTGATVDQPCTTVYSRWPTRIDWSPTGEAIAVGCGRTLTIFDASGASAPATFLMAEEPLAYRWTDGPGLVVASGGGNVYHVDASGTSTVVGRFEDPSIEIVSGTGVLSPDGRWLAYHGGERGDVPGNDFTEVGYLVPTSGGRPTRIPGELVDTTTWSDDSRCARLHHRRRARPGAYPARGRDARTVDDRQDRQPSSVPAAVPPGHLAGPVTGRNLVPGRRFAVRAARQMKVLSPVNNETS